MCALYVASTLVFIRMENKCIQMGWNAGQEEEECDDYDFDLDLRDSSEGAGHDQESNMHPAEFSPRYCIEDVLQRVTEDIKTTEYILSHPPSKTRTVVGISNSPSVFSTVTAASGAAVAKVATEADTPHATGVSGAPILTTMLSAIEEGETRLEPEAGSQSGDDLENNLLLPTPVDKDNDPKNSSKKQVRGDKTSIYSTTPQTPLLGES